MSGEDVNGKVIRLIIAYRASGLAALVHACISHEFVDFLEIFMPPKANVYASKRDNRRDEKQTDVRSTSIQDLEAAVISGIQQRFDSEEDDIHSFLKQILFELTQPSEGSCNTGAFQTITQRVIAQALSQRQYVLMSSQRTL